MLKFYEGLAVLKRTPDVDIVTLKAVYKSSIVAELKLHRLINKLDVSRGLLPNNAREELLTLYSDTAKKVEQEKSRLMQKLGLDKEENTYLASTIIYDIYSEVEEIFYSDLDIIKAINDNTDLKLSEYKETLHTCEYCYDTLRAIEAYRKELQRRGEIE